MEGWGTATAYDLRWSTSPITEQNFAAADVLTAPAPTAGGTRQSVTLAGFPHESTLYFALKARDEKPNVSALSNVARVRTRREPPAAVRNFTATAAASGTSVNLTWLPSGDDGNTGNATSYDIRYSKAPINATNFTRAPSVRRAATSPKPAMERYTLTGLLPQTKYYFAIKAIDDGGNKSTINNGQVTVETR